MQTDFDTKCLNNLAQSSISHDNVFDTLLSIMSVKTKAYNIESDPFIDCKSQHAIARTTAPPSLTMEISN